MAAIYQDGKIDGRDIREWHRACQTAVQANQESRILVAQLETSLKRVNARAITIMAKLSDDLSSWHDAARINHLCEKALGDK